MLKKTYNCPVPAGSKLTASTALPAVLFIFALLFSACNRTDTSQHWSAAIPQSAVMVYMNHESGNLNEVLADPFTVILNEINPTDLTRVSEVRQVSSADFRLKAMFIHPVGANSWSPVWIGETPGKSATDIASFFERAFTENSYRFDGQRIYRLFLQQGEIYFAVQLGHWLVVSPSSRGVEASVRSFNGTQSPAVTRDFLEASDSSLLINFPSLGRIIAQIGNVRYRPRLEHAFSGLQPAHLDFPETGDERVVRITAVSRASSQKSPLVKSLSAEATELTMDRFVPTDAAFFGMFTVTRETDNALARNIDSSLDSLLVNRNSRVANIASTLGNQAAVAGFNTPGFSSLEETLCIRTVSDRSTLRAELERLVEDGYGTRFGQTYRFRSGILSGVLGSDMCGYEDYTVGFADNILILTPRAGLVQRVQNDIRTRRTLFYNDEYMGFRSAHASRLSSFFYLDNLGFRSFIAPFTDPVADIESYLQYFDVISLSTVPDGSNVSINMELHQLERSVRPFADRWNYSSAGLRLTGTPVIGGLLRTGRNDLVLATESNQVIALAADGTEIFTVSTGNDRPVGSPVIFDWYANNQMAVFVAAGNKIYGWNNRGQALPNFPFVLDEPITSPLLIADISRSGLPEAVVATADRKIHVLGGRGVSLNGWPQTTNSVVRHKPVFEALEGRFGIWAFSENALFGWNSDGSLKSGLPVFAESPLLGSPVVHNNRIYGGGSDGRLYAVSKDAIFDSQIAVESSVPDGSAFRIQSVEVSDSPVIASKVESLRVPSLTVSAEGNQSLVNTSVIAAYSTNGSVFLYDLNGKLRFTQSLGQPISEGNPLIIVDLNRNNRMEILTVSDFGRLFAWTIETNSPFTGLPTTSVRYPVVSRLGADGMMNIIGQTQSGIQSWSIQN
ncbi:MAG: hypothetical protein LAT67_09340 [Balneolales bacterium]|nr:hypothetical protein [Balneolales bacterium]